ncbi:hypothetical protein [Lysinibacillus xylanilyticus]|uniref:hypothetical protein n=1 Tax=Lysinibacillus xylanilyticus TaxID=582475 RepID=UPI0036D828C1
MEKEKKQKIIIVSLSVLGVALVGVIVAMFLGIIKFDQAPGKKEEDDYVFDPSLIPTYPELSEVMTKAVKDIYGSKYEDLVENNSTDIITIPGTNITFPELYTSDSVDMMAMTLMAYTRNPYVDGVPKDLKQGAGESVKEMPDGTMIDLAGLVQQYTEIRYFTDRDNPSKISLEGYCNGEFFTESVDLMSTYAKYYSK